MRKQSMKKKELFTKMKIVKPADGTLELQALKFIMFRTNLSESSPLIQTRT